MKTPGLSKFSMREKKDDADFGLIVSNNNINKHRELMSLYCHPWYLNIKCLLEDISL